MALCLVTRVFLVACCAVVLYAFPRGDGNDAVPYSDTNDDSEVSTDQETLTIRDQEAVSIEIKNFEKMDNLNDTEKPKNDPIAMMVYDVIGQTRNSSRKKRSSQDYPDPCQNAKLDAITTTKSGSKYAFQGNYYWKLLENEIDEAYPRLISDDWDGLEGNLDAAFTFSSGETYFFKGTRYWRYINKRKDGEDFPKPIDDGFEEIPSHLDAAFVWGQNDKTYFFKGSQYWRYDKDLDPPVDPSYPKPLSAWSNEIAGGIDAAVQWTNGITYFFKDQQYYRYDDEHSEILQYCPPYPRSTGKYWFGCPS